jgi:hypothetical protein
MKLILKEVAEEVLGEIGALEEKVEETRVPLKPQEETGERPPLLKRRADREGTVFENFTELVSALDDHGSMIAGDRIDDSDRAAFEKHIRHNDMNYARLREDQLNAAQEVIFDAGISEDNFPMRLEASTLDEMGEDVGYMYTDIFKNIESIYGSAEEEVFVD